MDNYGQEKTMLKQLLDKYLKDYHDEVLQDEDCNINHQNAFAVLRHVHLASHAWNHESCIWGYVSTSGEIEDDPDFMVDSIRTHYGCNEGYRVGYSEQWVEGYLNG